MNIRIIISLLGTASVYLLAVVGAQHSESTESDSIHFYYDPDMHYFIASTRSTCFIVPLTIDERDHVHTNSGIEDLELQMMRDWMGVLPETRLYHDDHLPTNINRWCGHKDMFLLERPMNATSTPVSPLATKRSV